MKQNAAKKTLRPRVRRPRVLAEIEDTFIEEKALDTSENEVSVSQASEAPALSLEAAELIMGAEEVLARLSAQARGTLEPFLVESEGALFPDLTTKRAQANLFLLKKAKFKRRSLGGATNPVTETEVELELHDPQAALRDLGRHHKLFTERVESVAVGVLKVEIEYVDGA